MGETKAPAVDDQGNPAMVIVFDYEGSVDTNGENAKAAPRPPRYFLGHVNGPELTLQDDGSLKLKSTDAVYRIM